MNTEKIKYFIQNPLAISKEDVKVIEEVKALFPYSSTLHMLYIKGLANTNSISFESELKKAAIHVNDRERLHELVHSKSIGKQDVSQSTVELVLTEQVDELNNEILPIAKVEVEKTKSEKTPLVVGKVDEKPDMTKIIADIQLKVEESRRKKEVVIDEQEIKVAEKAEELPAAIIEKVKGNDSKIEEENELNKELEEVIPTDKQEKLSVDVLAHAMGVAFELDVDNIIREVEPKEEKQTVENTKDKPKENIVTVNVEELSFTEWLKYKQGKLEIDEQEVTEPDEVIKLSKKDINSLLNKFIDEEPRIKRPQKEFFNPVKNAKDSLEDSTVLVSETLAKIYWMQKKYDKAIKAYQQLSLRNPEKSTIFANQIKKIKKELNKI